MSYLNTRYIRIVPNRYTNTLTRDPYGISTGAPLLGNPVIDGSTLVNFYLNIAEMSG